MELTFEEKNVLPPGYSKQEYEAKDFQEKTILDVPIRTRPVHLGIQRDLSFLAQDGKFTADLVAFLKGGDSMSLS